MSSSGPQADAKKTADNDEATRYAHVRFVSAGAGSGKTYRLTQELERAIVSEGLDPRGIVATTFTVKAAGELRERVRERLISSGRTTLAEKSGEALIGTVHSVCERLLKRFAFELGLSPELHVASLEDCAAFFHQALDETLSGAAAGTMEGSNARPLSLPGSDPARFMNAVAFRLGIEDWRKDVKAIADRARDNDILPEALQQMGRQCAQDLLAHFPPPRDGAWDQRLIEAASAALDQLDLERDQTRKTRDYVAWLRAAIYQLRRPPAPWDIWIGASTKSAAKASEPIAARVRSAASVYASNPRLHQDLRGYIETAYTIAAASLERFQSIKRGRGLIDFTDMEQLLLHALDEKPIRARLRAELDLLLVDEFQDTNPMQLAIFMKLASLASRAVFVGDVKQAIYGFRGCDPELVQDTLRALTDGGGASETLGHSWRSRPALVEYINSIFMQAFGNELPREQIVLAAQREELTDEPSVVHWTLQGNADAAAAGLARGIAELVRSGHCIVCPETGTPREVAWGDIAVLAASNQQVEAIAKALRAANVPMKMTLSGLLTVPEICLAKACLRRLDDPTDTLATAEILSMTRSAEPETWLADRLRWLAGGRDGYAWSEDSDPILSRLRALREIIGTQAPVEVVARVLNTLGLREVVTAWGPNATKATQRQRNLDALLNLAVEYEHHCASQHLAATLTGFLFWLENPHSAELDLQPVVTTGDAVHVLTYHKSKGLEWPVVIAAHLHYVWPPGLWDPRIVNASEDFEIERPLARRRVRFWPNLFGERTNDVPVLDAIRDSAEGADCLRRDEAEKRRLAYVGLTRARDTLVLAVPGKNVSRKAWMHSFVTEAWLPTGASLRVGNASIPTAVTRLDTELNAADPEPFAPRRLPPRSPLEPAVRERVNPSAAAATDAAGIAETIELGPRLRLHGGDMTELGIGLHAAIAAELNNPDRPDALQRTRALLLAAGIDSYVSADAVLEAARHFCAWIRQRFTPLRVLTEYPVVHRLPDRRVVRGWIDVLLETREGWVVIDHKSSPRPRTEWPEEVRAYAGQLQVYAAALQACSKSVASCWVHFAVGGAAVRVDRVLPAPSIEPSQGSLFPE